MNSSEEYMHVLVTVQIYCLLVDLFEDEIAVRNYFHLRFKMSRISSS